MKNIRSLSALAAALAFVSPFALGQSTFSIDPTEPLESPISLADWDTDGDAEGWTDLNIMETVANGFYSGVSTNANPQAVNADPQLILNPLPSPIVAPPLATVDVEFSLRRPGSDGTQIVVFWGDGGGGFSANRQVVIPGDSVPADGEFHTYRVRLTGVVGSLDRLRIDGTTENNTALDFDFVRYRVNESPFQVDPAESLNSFVSLGEFETDTVQDRWITAALGDVSVSDGSLSGSSTGLDPQFVLPNLNLDTTTLTAEFLEMRLRRSAGENSRIDLFWADSSGGFGPDNRIAINVEAIPTDGAFHIYQIPITGLFEGELTALRIDPAANPMEAQVFDLDYVRLGSVIEDRDMDGLADSVENNTGEFVSVDMTGTDPDEEDSDDDNFLDGAEVEAGTDPNNGTDVPSPEILDYTFVDLNLRENEPAVAIGPSIRNGSPTGYSITPALPDGLSLDSATGVISGTPTGFAASQIYTVEVTFDGGDTDSIELTIAVDGPGLEGYAANASTYEIGTEIAPNTPVIRGAAPVGFVITPALPVGLTFDATTGTISGTPTAPLSTSDFTITASYPDTPDSETVISIRVAGDPVFLGVDLEPLRNIVSLGEWETDGDLEGWVGQIADLSVADGALSVTSTGADPKFRRIENVSLNGSTVLELRFSTLSTDDVQIFWGDASGGEGPDRQIRLGANNVIADGEFHTYQVDFEGAFAGDLTRLRIDAGESNGASYLFDYVRFGTVSPPQPPRASLSEIDVDLDEVVLSWTSNSGEFYTIQRNSDLRPENWENVLTDIPGDSGMTSRIIDDLDGDRFFRVLLQE